MVDALLLDETDVVGQRPRLVSDAVHLVTTSLLNVDDDVVAAADADDDDDGDDELAQRRWRDWPADVPSPSQTAPTATDAMYKLRVLITCIVVVVIIIIIIIIIINR